MKLFFLALIIACTGHSVNLKNPVAKKEQPHNNNIITGAEQTEKYLSFLKGRRVAVLANPTTIIGKRHLVDSLFSIGINITKAFGPEHGFRGNASNGAIVND